MDERKRMLSRAAENDPSARARLLNERVRSGEITQEHLKLTALLGEKDAQTVLNMKKTKTESYPYTLLPEIEKEYPKEVTDRLAIAFARYSQPFWKESDSSALADDLLSLLEQMMIYPESFDQRQITQARSDLLASNPSYLADTHRSAEDFGIRITNATAATVELAKEKRQEGLHFILSDLVDLIAAHEGTEPNPENLLFSASEEVRKWALNLGDPVAERVAQNEK